MDTTFKCNRTAFPPFCVNCFRRVKKKSFHFLSFLKGQDLPLKREQKSRRVHRPEWKKVGIDVKGNRPISSERWAKLYWTTRHIKQSWTPPYSSRYRPHRDRSWVGGKLSFAVPCSTHHHHKFQSKKEVHPFGRILLNVHIDFYFEEGSAFIKNHWGGSVIYVMGIPHAFSHLQIKKKRNAPSHIHLGWLLWSDIISFSLVLHVVGSLFIFFSRQGYKSFFPRFLRRLIISVTTFGEKNHGSLFPPLSKSILNNRELKYPPLTRSFTAIYSDALLLICCLDTMYIFSLPFRNILYYYYHSCRIFYTKIWFFWFVSKANQEMIY